MSLSCTVCEINGDFIRKSQNFPTPVWAFDCDAVMWCCDNMFCVHRLFLLIILYEHWNLTCFKWLLNTVSALSLTDRGGGRLTGGGIWPRGFLTGGSIWAMGRLTAGGKWPGSVWPRGRSTWGGAFDLDSAGIYHEVGKPSRDICWSRL